jgi:hypothetical protein
VYPDRPCRAAVELDPKPTTTSADTTMRIRRGAVPPRVRIRLLHCVARSVTRKIPNVSKRSETLGKFCTLLPQF